METRKQQAATASRSCEYEELGTCLVREYYSQTSTPILILNPSGECVLANSAASRTLMLEPRDIRGRAWCSVCFAPPFTDAILQSVQDVLRERRPVSGVIRTAEDHGRVLAYEMIPLRGDEGDINAVSVSFSDISEQVEGRRLSMALNEVQEAINSTLEFDEIVARVVDRSREVMEARSAVIGTRSDGVWKVRHASGEVSTEVFGDMTAEEALRLFPSIATGEIGMVEDVMGVEGARHDLLRRMHIRSALTIPLRQRGEIIGILIFNYPEVRKFSPIQIDYCRKLGQAVSIALENSYIMFLERTERQLLYELVEQSPAGIAVLSYPGLEVKLTNDLFRQHMRYQEPEDTGALMFAMPREVQEMVKKTFARAMDSGQVQMGEEVPIQINGESTSWTIQVVPLSGFLHGNLLLMAVDVTAQVKDRERMAELVREIEEERALLEAILDTLPVGILLVDPEGQVVRMNPARQCILEKFEMRTVDDLADLDGRWADNGIKIKKKDWPIVRSLKGESTQGEVIDIHTPDGKIRTIMASSSPVSSEGRLLGAVSAVSDITEQRHVEQEAIQARGRMELYLDLLSHDVNNLNAGAKGYLELLLDKAKLKGRARRHAEGALEQLNEVSRLVENVRKLQKVEVSGHENDLIDIGWVLDDIVPIHERTPGRDVSVYYKPTGKIMVHGNELLRDVFDNLLGNAVKHSEDPVEIRVTTSSAMVDGREFYRIGIEDNGPGVPDDIKPVIFNRMQRGRTTARGYGLGLYLVKNILDIFGGRVWVEDRVPGDHTKGARFVVLLPIASHLTG